MNKLFNRTFLRFSLGFITILLFSFVFAAVVKDYGERSALPTSTSRGS